MSTVDICTIQVDPLLQDYQIFLPVSIKKHLFEHKCTIKLGDKQARVSILFKQKLSAEIIISEKVADDLRVPKNQVKLQFYVNKKDATIVLGPILMIWTDVSSNDLSSPFFDFCKEVMTEGQNKGIFAFVQVKNQTAGLFWSDGGWQESARIPAPDVIYNRIHSRKYEKSSLFSSIKSQWKNAIIFNDHFLNKWVIHELLFTDIEIRKFLPKTHLLDLTQLLSTLADYPKAYLKPVNGSQGRGICFIDRQEEQNKFWVYVSESVATDPFLLKNIDQLSTFIEQLQKRDTYIVQHAIPIFTLDGQLVDFRFLLHYYERTWHITSAVARVGEKDRIISNQAQGGQLLKPLHVLEQWFPSEGKRKFEEMGALSKKVAETLQKSSNGLYCELGLDLAIDKDGGVWILEVNSKPSKTSPLREEIQIRPSARALCKTCLSLFHEQKNSK